MGKTKAGDNNLKACSFRIIFVFYVFGPNRYVGKIWRFFTCFKTFFFTIPTTEEIFFQENVRCGVIFEVSLSAIQIMLNMK